jgi:hypothetical protein
MADAQIVLNPGTGGDAVDAESIGAVKRQRAEIGGAALVEIARVMNATPAATDYGLVVRPRPMTSATCTQTNVAALASSVTLLAANAARKGFSISNDAAGTTGARLYLCMGTGPATATNWVEYVEPGETYTDTFSYTGAVTGIWLSANGFARVGEWA